MTWFPVSIVASLGAGGPGSGGTPVVRALPRVASMTLSVLLRIVRNELAEGRLVGEVRIVESGTVAVFRSLEELMSILEADPAGRPEAPRPSGAAVR
jgi:hypothetical protein